MRFLPGKLLPFVVLSIAVVLVVTSVYFYTKYSTTQSLLKSFGSEQDKVGGVVAKVSKHFDLPQDDQVTLATVSDITKLKNQSFFAKAQNNDKVLIYPKSSLAILYREKIDRIINVGPINTQAETLAQAQPLVTPSPVSMVVRTAIYNGTKTVGLARRAEKSLEAFSRVKTDVVIKANSANDYEQTVVVDLSRKNKDSVENIAEFVGGKVGALPAGEVVPEGADVLIILGQLYVNALTTTPAPTN